MKSLALVHEEFVRFLPQFIKELISLIGMEETKLLLSEAGGTKRYIPKNMTRQTDSWAMLSSSSRTKMSSKYAGETLEIPKLDSIRRAERDYEIMMLSMQGASRSQLGRRYGLTYRQIGNIRKRYRSTKDGLRR